jgi:hypothetical protein
VKQRGKLCQIYKDKSVIRHRPTDTRHPPSSRERKIQIREKVPDSDHHDSEKFGNIEVEFEFANNQPKDECINS